MIDLLPTPRCDVRALLVAGWIVLAEGGGWRPLRYRQGDLEYFETKVGRWFLAYPHTLNSLPLAREWTSIGRIDESDVPSAWRAA